jgi:hypothetical protein
MSAANSSQPFTQSLDGASTVSNANITEIDLVFSYSAPITSSTYTYSGTSGGSGLIPRGFSSSSSSGTSSTYNYF